MIRFRNDQSGLGPKDDSAPGTDELPAKDVAEGPSSLHLDAANRRP